MYRLRHSLHLLQKEFSQEHLRATKARLLLEETSALVRETMQQSETQTSEELAKVIYVFDLFETEEELLKQKIKEGIQAYGLSKECIKDYLLVHTHTHASQVSQSHTI